MIFYQGLEKYADNIALIEGDVLLSYAELEQKVIAFCQKLPSARQLVVITCRNNIDTLVAYLACLRSGHVAILTEYAEHSDKLNAIVDAFQPNLLIQAGEVHTYSTHQPLLHPDCRILLPTSGSTGSAKHVALSANNLHANCQSICAYLPIESRDTTITTLPFMYSYGLSVINTHLAAGAAIVLNEESVLSREFWALMKKWPISSLAGVPYTYEMLLRLRFDKQDWPQLRYFTQAGGALARPLVEQLAAFAIRRNCKFYRMYGQTEATARIAYLSPSLVQNKPSSIGKAIPGGKLILLDEQGEEIKQPLVSGELVYQGENIMLGYVAGSEDLQHFAPKATLHTGDIAMRDEQGDFIISGRKKRIVKPFGRRVSLDEIEHYLQEQSIPNYCCQNEDRILIITEKSIESNKVIAMVSEYLNLHHSAIKHIVMSPLPVNAHGKRDYEAAKAYFLRQSLEQSSDA